MVGINLTLNKSQLWKQSSKEWLVRVVAAAGPETGRTKATRQCELWSVCCSGNLGNKSCILENWHVDAGHDIGSRSFKKRDGECLMTSANLFILTFEVFYFYLILLDSNSIEGKLFYQYRGAGWMPVYYSMVFQNVVVVWSFFFRNILK
jgi:hypothetical protein